MHLATVNLFQNDWLVSAGLGLVPRHTEKICIASNYSKYWKRYLKLIPVLLAPEYYLSYNEINNYKHNYLKLEYPLLAKHKNHL